jgi:hypothetical protein
LLVIALGVLAVACTETDDEDQANFTVAVTDLLDAAPENFTVVYEWGSDENEARAVWRRQGDVERWDFVTLDDGKLAGGLIHIVRSPLESGAEGTLCSWARRLDDVTFWLSCTEGGRAFGPGADAWEAVMSADATDVIEEIVIAGASAKCRRVGNGLVTDGYLCLTEVNIPVVIEAAGGRSTTAFFDGFNALSVDLTESPLTYPLLPPGVREGEYPAAVLELPELLPFADSDRSSARSY